MPCSQWTPTLDLEWQQTPLLYHQSFTYGHPSPTNDYGNLIYGERHLGLGKKTQYLLDCPSSLLHSEDRCHLSDKWSVKKSIKNSCHHS